MFLNAGGRLHPLPRLDQNQRCRSVTCSRDAGRTGSAANLRLSPKVGPAISQGPAGTPCGAQPVDHLALAGCICGGRRDERTLGGRGSGCAVARRSPRRSRLDRIGRAERIVRGWSLQIGTRLHEVQRGVASRCLRVTVGTSWCLSRCPQVRGEPGDRQHRAEGSDSGSSASTKNFLCWAGRWRQLGAPQRSDVGDLGRAGRAHAQQAIQEALGDQPRASHRSISCSAIDCVSRSHAMLSVRGCSLGSNRRNVRISLAPPEKSEHSSARSRSRATAGSVIDGTFAVKGRVRRRSAGRSQRWPRVDDRVAGGRRRRRRAGRRRQRWRPLR